MGSPREEMVRMVEAHKNIRLGCKWKGVVYVTITVPNLWENKKHLDSLMVGKERLELEGWR